MKTLKGLTHLTWIVLLLFACCDTNNRTNQEVVESDSEVAEEIAQISNDLTLQSETVIQPAQPDNDSTQFAARMDSITALFAAFGFEREADTKLNSLEHYRKHWWLKKYRRSTLGKTPDFPSEDDLAKIKSINQFAFKKAWKYKIEQWNFDSETAAQRWFDIAKYAHGSRGGYYLEKPPNDVWLEGDKLYIIMATAAADWFEYSNRVVEEFSGMTRAEIRERME